MDKNIRYLTDTGSGLYTDYFKEKGIDCLPLQIGVENKNYLDMQQYSTSQLYLDLQEKLKVTTSMTPYGMIDQYFEQCQKDGVQMVVASPICPGLSGNYNAIEACAREYDIELYNINHYVTAVVQTYLIEQVKKAFEAGYDLDYVKEKVAQVVDSCNTLIIPADIQHLKRGGRLTPLAATLASLLKISPVLQINKSTDGKVDTLAKIRTMKKSIAYVVDMIVNNCSDAYQITITHINNIELANQVKQMILSLKPELNVDVIALCNTVSVHIGLNGLAFQYFEKVDFSH